MRKTFFLLLILFNIYSGYSLEFHWSLDPIVIKNGLNNNTIYDICHGKGGFIWLSTDQGITRYDGFRFRDYSLTVSLDSTSVALPQTVKKIEEVSDGFLYIQLYHGGLVCFDKNKEKFLFLRFNKPFKQREILDFYWKNDTLFLATSHGLYESKVVHTETEEESFMYCTLNMVPLVSGKVTNLCVDDEEKNLYFSVNGKKIIRYDIITRKSAAIQEYDIVNRLFLQNGYLWICKMWNDVVCYDLKKHKEKVIIKGAIDKVDYSNSYVTDLVSKDERTYYMTTWNGVFKIDFKDKDLCESSFDLVSLIKNADTLYSNVESKMTSALWDNKQNILWVGTFGGGIVKFDQSDGMYTPVLQKLKSRVCGMAEDSKGYIWLVMTDGSIMKSKTSGLSMYSHFELWEKLSEFSGCHCIYKDKNGNLWLGNNRGKVAFINPVTGDVRKYDLNAEGGENMPTNIYGFCKDVRNSLWVATSVGLMQLTNDKNDFRLVEPIGGKIDVAYAITEDKEGNIWVGTNKGLKRLEIVGKQIRMVGDYETENGLDETAVRTVYVNNYNQIYAAYLNIVVRVDGRNKDKLDAVYSIHKGLTSGHVSCMIDDQIGNTWAGNNVGIMTIRNGQEAFYSYLTVGNCSAVCRLNDGRLLWANSWGLMFFDPSVVKETEERKQLMLTDVELGGRSVLVGEKRNNQVILTVSPEKQEKLVFNADNNDFCLHFSDLNYGMMHRKIAYRILPGDEEWSMKPLRDGVSYNGLAAGKYILEVKLVFPDAREGDILQIPIIVKDRWYRTFWAYFSYGILALLLFYLLYRYFNKKNLLKQIRHEHEIVLKEKFNVEKNRHMRNQEIEIIRNRLLILFVQEMRTPLSLIIGPLKDLLKDKTMMPEFASRGLVAYRSSLRMLDACDQLLTIFGQENFNEKLEVAPYQIEKMIDNNLSGVRELLKVCPIDFQYEKRIKKDMEFYADKKIVEFIIHFLLTNAFTHVNYAGKVSLTVSEVVLEKIPYVTIIIEDDGKIEFRSIEQLVEEGGGADKDLTSTELGYSVIKRIVEMHHGTTLFESEKGKGTKVTVNFPIEREMFENDPDCVFVTPEELEDLLLEPLETFHLKKEDETDGLRDVGVIKQNITTAEGTPNVSKGGKKTLLIVEDQKDIRLYLKVLFGKEYNLLMATNGQEGIDMAFRELPDLIICDVMMPVKDGFECCREVKENPETCSIPFIILTAKVEDEDVVRGLELGADDYVLKPFTPSILKAKVRSLIDGRYTLKQMYTKLLMLPGTDNNVSADNEEVLEEAGKLEDPFITSVVKIVEENISEADFSVKKLASDMNMSQPTLYRKVKQSTDYTVIELIRGVRMRRAAVLLKTKQHAVQEVAEMVGYNDIPTFRKHFVDAFGKTPSTYE